MKLTAMFGKPKHIPSYVRDVKYKIVMSGPQMASIIHSLQNVWIINSNCRNQWGCYIWDVTLPCIHRKLTLFGAFPEYSIFIVQQ